MCHGLFDRKSKLLILSALYLFCLTVHSFSQENNTVPIPLYIDNIYAGEISVVIPDNETVQVRPSELIAYLEELMSDDAVSTARKIFPSSGWVDLTEMGGLGVRIVFAFEDLTMHVVIPAHLKRETVISLKGKYSTPEGNYIDNTDFSAFLNLEFWNRFTYETQLYDFSVTPELGLNIFDWVLEARGGIRNREGSFFLDYARMVKDFSAMGYRLEAGDLTMPVTDITGVSRLLGISFRKNYDLTTGNETRLPYAEEVFIREPTKVEIYMNDRKIREKDFQSGSYIFQDFPLTRGVNRISIRWEDSEGEHEENIVIPYDSSLLAAGEFDLGIAAGVPEREFVLPSVSTYQYLGITDKLTFGITESFNVDTLELVIHPDFLMSSGIGNFNLVPIWALNLNGGQKVKASLGYQMLKPGQDSYLSFGGTVSYSHDSISYTEVPLSLLSLDGYYNLYFGDSFSFTPEASWGHRFDENRNTFRVRGILKKSIKGGSSLSANIGISYDEDLSFSATISYSSSFPDINQNLYLLENLETQKLSAYWNKYSSEDSNYSLNASAELPMNLDEEISMGLSGGYENSLFSIDGGHDFDTIIDTSSFSNATYLRAASSVVYADGNFIVSKPVNDSFIIIAPGIEFEDQMLKVNPSSGGSDLELNGKPGVMSNINSFSTYKVYVIPEELPPGMDDSEMKYLIKPSYKSAFVIKPHAEVKIFAGGFIRDDTGEPVETALGTLTGKNTSVTIDFFTDENGYFEAYGLQQDIYTMNINGHEQTAELDLSGVPGGFYDTGTITIPEDK